MKIKTGKRFRAGSIVAVFATVMIVATMTVTSIETHGVAWLQGSCAGAEPTDIAIHIPGGEPGEPGSTDYNVSESFQWLEDNYDEIVTPQLDGVLVVGCEETLAMQAGTSECKAGTHAVAANVARSAAVPREENAASPCKATGNVDAKATSEYSFDEASSVQDTYRAKLMVTWDSGIDAEDCTKTKKKTDNYNHHDTFTGDVICGVWKNTDFPGLISTNNGNTELWTQLKQGSFYWPGEGSETSADTDWGGIVVAKQPSTM